MNKVFWPLLLSFYMSSCTPTYVADADFLEHEEIVSLISGNTLTGTIVRGNFQGSFDMFMMENGKLSSRNHNGKGFGKWQVFEITLIDMVGGKLCFWQSQVKYGTRICRLLGQVDDGYLMIVPANRFVTSRFRVLPGNARNLEIP